AGRRARRGEGGGRGGRGRWGGGRGGPPGRASVVHASGPPAKLRGLPARSMPLYAAPRSSRARRRRRRTRLGASWGRGIARGSRTSWRVGFVTLPSDGRARDCPGSPARAAKGAHADGPGGVKAKRISLWTPVGGRGIW